MTLLLLSFSLSFHLLTDIYLPWTNNGSLVLSERNGSFIVIDCLSRWGAKPHLFRLRIDVTLYTQHSLASEALGEDRLHGGSLHGFWGSPHSEDCAEEKEAVGVSSLL